jgi:methionyl-tRNA synthetase
METTIACCIECIKALALISFPIIPETANKVWKMLGFASNLEEHSWQDILKTCVPEGQSLPKPEILFRKIEDDQIQGEIAKLQGLAEKQKKTLPQGKMGMLKEEIDYDGFQKLDLRVGLILKAVPVPKSKKLLQLEVDLGFEKRTIVSGIAQFYNPEVLIGKKVVVVANLQPAKIMGVESRGMILAAHNDATLEVVDIEALPPGSVVS